MPPKDLQSSFDCAVLEDIARAASAAYPEDADDLISDLRNAFAVSA